MKQYLKMVDLIRQHGIHDLSEIVPESGLLSQRTREFAAFFAPPGSSEFIGRQLSEFEWGIVEASNQFVFHGDGGEVWYANDPDSEIDLPFETVSFENLDDQINVAQLDFSALVEQPQGSCLLCFSALLVHEVEPKKRYEVFALNNSMSGEWVVKIPHRLVATTIKRRLDRLAKEKAGVEFTRSVVKIGAGKSKRVHRIRRIIHIAPSKGAAHGAHLTKSIDWSHRFEVRGHWRKLDGIGKDRRGDYSVNGLTWVVHHTKGPEHLPLIKKVRVVDAK